MFSKLFKKHKTPIVNARAKPEDEQCPFCAFGTPIIYDQTHDCCTTCKTKWIVAR